MCSVKREPELIETLQDDVVIFRVNTWGVPSEALACLAESVAERIAEGHRDFVIDLSDVRLLGAVCMGVVIKTTELVRRAGGTSAVVRPASTTGAGLDWALVGERLQGSWNCETIEEAMDLAQDDHP